MTNIYRPMMLNPPCYIVDIPSSEMQSIFSAMLATRISLDDAANLCELVGLTSTWLEGYR